MNQQIISTELVAVKPCRACGAVDRNKRGNCKPCANERRRKWGAINRDKVRKANREWRETNPEKARKAVRKWAEANAQALADRQRKYYEANRKQISESKRRHREDNREQIAERNSKWQKANPDKVAERNRKWKQSNPEKVKVVTHNRRAKAKGNGGKLSASIVQKLLTKQNNKCVCCGASLDNGYHLDHIMPLALGGMNDDSNVQLLTPKCNMSKGSKHPDVWAGEKGIKLS